MNRITRYKKIILSGMMLVGMSMNAAEAPKCTPCQAAAAARQSARDAAAQAALIADKTTREMELDVDPVISQIDGTEEERCSCQKPKPKSQARCAVCAEGLLKQSIADALAAVAASQLVSQADELERCNCQKPKPKSQERCAVCAEGLLKQSIADALAIVLTAANAIAKSMDLDMDGSKRSVRAPREALDDPSNACDIPGDCDLCCVTDDQELLKELICSEAVCCATINKKLDTAAKCCKKIKRELNEIEDLVGSQIDQSIACCSVVETTLGSIGNSAIDFPICNFSIVDFVDSNNADVITWLKSLYVLLYQVYLCSCDPCT